MCALIRAGASVGLLVVSSLLCSSSASAQQPELVPRLLIVEQPQGISGGPDWDQWYSVSLVAVPNDRLDTTSIAFNSWQDFEFIKSKINANTGLSGQDLDDLANLTVDLLKGFTALSQTPLHATMVNVEPNLDLVFWAPSLPPPGARAKSGPDGNIILLGGFGIKEISPLEDPLNPGGYRITQSGASRWVHLAMGWFTK